LAADGSNIVSPASIADCVEVRYSIVTDHFSLYAPIVATDVGAPVTPSGLAGSALSTASISLSWTLTSGATSYDIYRSDASAGTYTRLGSEPTVSSGSTVTYTDSGLSAGTTYFYKITSLNGSGESAASTAVSAATQSAPASSSGGGGGGAASSITTTSPSITPTPLPVSSSAPVVVPLATSPVVQIVPSVSVTTAPSAPRAVNPPTLNPLQVTGLVVGQVFAPRAAVSFNYRYVNASNAPQSLQITRQILDARGRVVKTSRAQGAVKAGAGLMVRVQEPLSATFVPGRYTMRLVVKNAKGGAILQRQDVSFEIAKPAKKIKAKK